MTSNSESPAMRHPYADETKDQSGGRLLLATMGLSIVFPLLLISCYLIGTRVGSADLVPPTFGLVVLFVWLTSRAFRAFRDRLPEENESVMNFSPLGLLTCVCEDCVPNDPHHVERRQSCRTCGLTIVAREPARLKVVLSSREITKMQARLRDSAIKAKGMEIPATVENIDDLVDYLKTAPPPPPPSVPPTHVRTKRYAS